MLRYRELCKRYFSYFSNKDIDNLSNVYSEDVILRDWDTAVQGKEQVLDTNKNTFDAVDNIEVIVIEQAQIHNIVYNEIEIKIDNESLLVVDVIEFDNDNLIKSVKAYKG